MTVLETARLRLCQLTLDDAGFILRLLNEPSFINNIGDRGVRSLAEASEYLRRGPIDSYQSHGHGLYRVELKEGAAPIGICGLIYRELLREVDVGYALLPEFCGQGYASEATAATLVYGRETLGMRRIVALTTAANRASIRVLEKNGLRFEKKVRLAEGAEEIDREGQSPAVVDLYA